MMVTVFTCRFPHSRTSASLVLRKLTEEMKPKPLHAPSSVVHWHPAFADKIDSLSLEQSREAAGLTHPCSAGDAQKLRPGWQKSSREHTALASFHSAFEQTWDMILCKALRRTWPQTLSYSLRRTWGKARTGSRVGLQTVPGCRIFLPNFWQ